MTKVLANRWFRWTLLAFALSGLGVGIYRVTPPEPMWEIDAPSECRTVVIDSNQAVAVLPSRGRESYFSQGPIRLLSIQTGNEIAQFLDETTNLDACALSKDHRYFAAEIARAEGQSVWIESLIIVDLVNGKAIQVPSKVLSEGRDLRFSPNGAFLAHFCEGDTKLLRIYESATGKLLAQRACVRLDDISDEFALFQNKDGAIEAFELHKLRPIRTFEKLENQAFCLLKRGCIMPERPVDAKSKKQEWSVWNLHTQKVEGQFSMDALKRNDSIQFSDPYVVVRRIAEHRFVEDFRELPSGRLLDSISSVGWLCTKISPRGDVLAVQSEDRKSLLRLIELPTMRTRWAVESQYQFTPMAFGGDSQTLFTWQDESYEVHAYDCITGKRLLVVSLPHSVVDADFGPTVVEATPDHRNVLVHRRSGGILGEPNPAWEFARKWIPGLNNRSERENDVVVVIDAIKCRVRFRMEGWDGRRATLSDDGCTLITKHSASEDECIIRCWDVDAWKPLHWAIGMPAGLAAAIGLFAWWRGRRKAA